MICLRADGDAAASGLLTLCKKMIQRSGGFTYTNYYIVASTGDHSDGMIMTLLSIFSNCNEQRGKFGDAVSLFTISVSVMAK